MILALALVIAVQLWGLSYLFALFMGRPEPGRWWAVTVAALIFLALV